MKIFTEGLKKVDCFYTAKLYTKPCAFGQRGTFARKEIKKGEIVAIYTGRAVGKDVYDTLSLEIKHYAYGIGDGQFLIPYSLETLDEDDFINHSCNPNVGIVGLNVLVAMKTIKKNEEVTIDYAMCDTVDEQFVCLCREKSCRKVITGNDWRLPSLQKKYKTFFSDYILRKIDDEKKKETVNKIASKDENNFVFPQFLQLSDSKQ